MKSVRRSPQGALGNHLINPVIALETVAMRAGYARLCRIGLRCSCPASGSRSTGRLDCRRARMCWRGGSPPSPDRSTWSSTTRSSVVRDKTSRTTRARVAGQGRSRVGWRRHDRQHNSRGVNRAAVDPVAGRLRRGPRFGKSELDTASRRRCPGARTHPWAPSGFERVHHAGFERSGIRKRVAPGGVERPVSDQDRGSVRSYVGEFRDRT